MNKILLVYEDYADLMNVEASLKKIGFDILGVTNEYSLSEQVLSFNPEVVIASGKGAKVSALGVGKRMKEMVRWPGKVVLIFGGNEKPAANEIMKIRADLMLEAPVPPQRLIQVLAKLLGHDEAQLLERLNKVAHSETGGAADKFFVGGPPAAEKEVLHIPGRGTNTDEKPVSGEEAGGSFLSRLKNAKDLYQDEALKPADPAGGSETLFPDVDLKSLEAEITGKPANDKVSPIAEPANQPEALSETTIAELREELELVQGTVSDRVAQYSKFTKSVEVSPVSTVRRVEARRRQRDLVKDWDKENLSNTDNLRREFTKALFKK